MDAYIKVYAFTLDLFCVAAFLARIQRGRCDLGSYHHDAEDHTGCVSFLLIYFIFLTFEPA